MFLYCICLPLSNYSKPWNCVHTLWMCFRRWWYSKALEIMFWSLFSCCFRKWCFAHTWHSSTWNIFLPKFVSMNRHLSYLAINKTFTPSALASAVACNTMWWKQSEYQRELQKHLRYEPPLTKEEERRWLSSPLLKNLSWWLQIFGV